MENYGLGTHNDKLCADSLPGNIPQILRTLELFGWLESLPNTLQFIRLINYLGYYIFEKALIACPLSMIRFIPPQELTCSILLHC